MGCSTVCQAISRMNVTLRAALPPPKKNMPRVKIIIITVIRAEIPMAPILADWSARFAVRGWRITARMFATARVTPMPELEYPLASRNTEAKLLTTA